MRNMARALLVAATLAAGLVSSASGQQRAEDPRALVAKYQAAVAGREKVSMSVQTEMDWTSPRGNGKYTLRVLLRRDQDRLQLLGESRSLDEEGHVIPDDSLQIGRLYTKEMGYEVMGNLGKPIDFVYAIRNSDSQRKLWREQPDYGAALEGQVPGGQHKDVAQLLAESADLSVRDASEEVEGVSCRVVEGSTPFGKVTAWIAPSLGHNAMKYVIVKKGKDLYDDQAVADQGIREWVMELDAVKVADVGGVPVPVSGRLTLAIRMSDGKEDKMVYRYSRKDIVLNPDFESMGAFQPKFPEGTRINLPGLVGRFEWRHNTIVHAADRQAKTRPWGTIWIPRFIAGAGSEGVSIASRHAFLLAGCPWGALAISVMELADITRGQ